MLSEFNVAAKQLKKKPNCSVNSVSIQFCCKDNPLLNELI